MSKQKTRGPWNYHDRYKLLDEFGNRVQTTNPKHQYLGNEAAAKVACRYMAGNPNCQEIQVGKENNRFSRNDPAFQVIYKEYLKTI